MPDQVARILLAAGILIAWVHPALSHLKQTGNSAPDITSAASSLPSRWIGTGGPLNDVPHRAVIAQAPDGHSEHHPKGGASTPDTPTISPPATPPTPQSNSPVGSPSPAQSMPGMGSSAPGAGGAMGGMMGGCMGAGCMGASRKEFYASLMAMPNLSPEQRQRIEAQARAWINAGTEEIASAENALRHANAAGDSVGAEQATSRMRDALAQVKSGNTILRSLSEGKPPRQIALDWFKGEMNLAPDTVIQDPVGPLGLSWFHLVTMALVTAFAAAMLAIYLSRMRRANALIDRLTGARPAPGTSAPAVPAVPTAGSPAAGASGVAAADPASSKATVAPASSPRTGLWKGQLRVAAIFRETPQVKTFRLRDPQGGPIPFSFAPGQFLTYSADIDGKRVRRSYTIASSAAQTAYVETTIKREEKGVFSEFMHDQISEGDLIDVIAPSGVFTFTGVESDSVVLIGGGVGITPLMAAIRYLADTCWNGEIYLVYGARSTEEFIFRDELEHRQRKMHNLHVAATMARSAGTSWMGAEGPINREFLIQSVPDIAKRRVHLCGPPGMMQAMRKLLADLAIPSAQVKTEAFGPALGAVPPPGFTEVAGIREVSGAAGTVSAPPIGVSAIGPATASLRFAKSDKVVPLPPDKSVLEIAESIGVPIDYSCRVGVCGVCKTKLLEGNVTMEVEEALTPEDKANGIILACQAKSIGNLVVEA